jgi:hypothetical protein
VALAEVEEEIDINFSQKLRTKGLKGFADREYSFGPFIFGRRALHFIGGFMKFPTPTHRVAKGQLKCFDCRRSLVMKEGNWYDRGNQQVFLCHSCVKAQQEFQHKRPLSR